jgi:hypothetical protein
LASSQETKITGWRQPPSAAHSSHSSKVTSNRPTANGREIVTIIISGQFAQSLNVSFGSNAFSFMVDRGAAWVDAAAAGVGIDLAGGVCATAPGFGGIVSHAIIAALSTHSPANDVWDLFI